MARDSLISKEPKNTVSWWKEWVQVLNISESSRRVQIDQIWRSGNAQYQSRSLILSLLLFTEKFERGRSSVPKKQIGVDSAVSINIKYERVFQKLFLTVKTICYAKARFQTNLAISSHILCCFRLKTIMLLCL